MNWDIKTLQSIAKPLAWQADIVFRVICNTGGGFVNVLVLNGGKLGLAAWLRMRGWSVDPVGRNDDYKHVRLLTDGWPLGIFGRVWEKVPHSVGRAQASRRSSQWVLFTAAGLPKQLTTRYRFRVLQRDTRGAPVCDNDKGADALRRVVG